MALFAAGIAGIPLGLLVKRKRPAARAVIAAGGSVVAALVRCWLILPLVAAAVASALAVRRARRLAQANR